MSRTIPRPWRRSLLGLLGLIFLLFLLPTPTQDREETPAEQLSQSERALLDLGQTLSYRDFIELLHGDPALIEPVQGDVRAIFRLIDAGLPSHKAACVANLQGCPVESRITLLVFDAPPELKLTSDRQPFLELERFADGRLRIFTLEDHPSTSPIPVTLDFGRRECRTILPGRSAFGGILIESADGRTPRIRINGAPAVPCQGNLDKSNDRNPHDPLLRTPQS